MVHFQENFSCSWQGDTSYLVQFSQSCLTLCNPMDCSTQGFPVHHQLPEIAQNHVHPVDNVIQPSHPLCPLLLPSIFPSIRVFSNESVLHIRWPKYWSLIFSISPSNEYSGLISFRTDWLESPCCPRDSQEYSPTLTSIHDYWKNHSLD